MKNLRGNHTTFTPLAQEIVKILSKNISNIEFAPGLIIRKGIKIKGNAIILENQITSILMTILMKGSKQFVRIYKESEKENLILQINSILNPICKEKQILLKIKSQK